MITLSVDDGCLSDIRIAELCRKYEMQCVFYWPVEWRSLAYSKGYEPLDIVNAYIISQDFEIGSHTVTHRYLTQISELDAQIEILDSKYMLESLFNKKITKFCPPRGYTNQELTEFTLNTYESQRLTKGDELVHIHPNSGANDNKPWRDCISDKTTEIWCHSWELDKYNIWSELEAYLANPSS